MVRTCGTEPPSVNGGHLADAPPKGGGHELPRRKPRLLLELSGLSLLRLETRAFDASLFQSPPRLTRFEPTTFLPRGLSRGERPLSTLCASIHRIEPIRHGLPP